MKMRPSLEDVLAFDGDASHLAVSIELAADTETPISLYYKLSSDRPNAFLLESVEGGEVLGRYSFIGFDLDTAVRYEGGRGFLDRGGKSERLETADPLHAVETLLRPYRVHPRPDLPRFQGGAVGFLGFDAVRHFERVPIAAANGIDLPEVHFFFAEELAIFDHLRQRVILVAHLPLAGDRGASYRRVESRLRTLVARFNHPPPPPRILPGDALPLPSFEGNRSRADFMDAVQRAKSAIAAGEIFQVALSQRLTVPGAIDPFALYRALRALNPSPYMFYFRREGASIVGASPEVLVRKEGDEVLVRPIAGTRPRGATANEDEALERELLKDEKELAEHLMLVDLGRNDVGRIAKLGSVRVDDALHIERYSHVMHIVSDVRGNVAKAYSAFDVLRACFPAGTVSGAPKIRAMELIAELEPDRRGLYAGAVGYFDFTGNMDTCIAIRTMIVEPEAVHLQVGAGIVFDSDPAREYEECINKAKSGLSAIALARAEED